MQINISTTLKYVSSEQDNWLPAYPNPADFRFDYFKLLASAPDGIATLPEGEEKNIAIVGAGCAGMTAARELVRCGYNVTLYEATDRIGGRLYTEENPLDAMQTGMELGAMRMPFFPEPGSKNCILEYYMLQEAGNKGHEAKYDQFPNPGSAPGDTGIFINRGYGPNNEYPSPELIKWKKGCPADNDTIMALADKAGRFIKFFESQIRDIYTEDSNEWTELWDRITQFYTSMTFNDLVIADAICSPNLETGNFGGFGMNDKEATLLYTIGTGDGSWGAFYSVSALWFIRCTMFGFGGESLQTVKGLSSPDGLPFYNQQTFDSLNRPLPAPTYQGIQSLVEYLYYVPAPGQQVSLHENEKVKLYSKTSVENITLQDSGKLAVFNDGDRCETYDHVFISSGQWASQMSFQLNGFSDEQLPQNKITTDHTQHNISSCKLFFPLKEKYWLKKANKIPQVLVTDTYIQDAYALSWDTSDQDHGVILASYTWEDDSLKLLPFDEERLVELVTSKLQQITTETVGQDITEYFVKDKPVMIQWITQPTYDGCAKLYRQRNETNNRIDLSYNQNYSNRSNLYFIGENYSVEGGWTEPALRSALDGVMQLLNHSNAEFKVDNFNFSSDYPRWPEVK